MTTEEFWDIIAVSRSEWNPHKAEGNAARQLVHLGESLSSLKPDELFAFTQHYTHYHFAAYHWDLWAAAYLYEGGCSDDGFHYFRDWLISMGKDVYVTALRNPDTLADVYSRSDIEYTEFEELGYVMERAYRAKTGREMPPTGLRHPQEPAGNAWDSTAEENGELARRFPNLYARYEADAN